MRFHLSWPRADAPVSAAEVRALREGRGWTAEQLADAVGASPLEASAWESGAVRVPPEQAEQIRWLIDTDAWSASAAAAKGEPCAWVREHRPDLYDAIFADAGGGTWYGGSAEVREHFAGCATCNAAWRAAQRIGPPPADPSAELPHAPNTPTTRYRRWVKGFPRWLHGPLNLLWSVGHYALLTLAILTIPESDSGFPAHVYGAGFGVGVCWAVLRVIEDGLGGRARRWPRVAGVLAGLAGGAAGALWWCMVDDALHLADPRVWAGAAAVGVAVGLIRARRPRDDAEDTPHLHPPADGGRPALAAPQPGWVTAAPGGGNGFPEPAERRAAPAEPSQSADSLGWRK